MSLPPLDRSGFHTAPPGGAVHPEGGSPAELSTFTNAMLLSFQAGKLVNYTGEPLSNVYVPVMDSFEDDRKTVAILVATIRWSSAFEAIFTEPEEAVDVVLSNTCEGDFTYKIRGSNVIFIGQGNHADPAFEESSIYVELDEHDDSVVEPDTIELTMNKDACRYSLHVYPTEAEDCIHGKLSWITTLAVGAVFIMTAAVFHFYDVMVERRQMVVLSTAQRSTAIVSSMFPKKIRDQLLEAPVQGNATKLRSLFDLSKRPDEDEDTAKDRCLPAKPIADLFPDCTGEFTLIDGIGPRRYLITSSENDS